MGRFRQLHPTLKTMLLNSNRPCCMVAAGLFCWSIGEGYKDAKGNITEQSVRSKLGGFLDDWERSSGAVRPDGIQRSNRSISETGEETRTEADQGKRRDAEVPSGRTGVVIRIS